MTVFSPFCFSGHILPAFLGAFIAVFFTILTVTGTPAARAQDTVLNAENVGTAGIAANPVNPERNQPIEITATRTLEWHRNDRFYIARGDAVARQGRVSVLGQTLRADYHEREKNASMRIWRLRAQGDVMVTSDSNTAYGDEAVYDIEQGLAVMTGQSLKLVSDGQVITAQDRFEYWPAQGKALAIGKAVLQSGENILRADQMIAFFSKEGKDAQKLESMEAVGNVVIETPTETLYGDRGQYVARSNIAEIHGDVRIVRGPNILEGKRANIDLNTNISRMYGTSAAGPGATTAGTGGSPAQNGRVRGIFYPGAR